MIEIDFQSTEDRQVMEAYSNRVEACITIVLVAMMSSWACERSHPGPEAADLVLRGGRVVTLGPAGNEAEAVAIVGPWIRAVGDDAEIAAHIGPGTRIIDLNGRLAIPGFIEGHGHFLSLGEALTVIDLTTATDWNQIVSLVEEAVSRAAPGDWIVGRGWHQEKWGRAPDPAVQGAPVHDSLSAVSPDNPVVLEHASGHAVFANGRALELAGLDRDAEPPPGGELIRDKAGRLTGLLRETAQDPVWEAVERERMKQPETQRRAELESWVELAGQEALAHGVTSFHDAGASFSEIDLFKDLEARGALPVRLYVMVRGESNEDMDERLADFRMPAEGNDFLTVRSIKRQIDGALGAHGAWLLEPYTDLPTSTGLVLESEEEIRETARIAIRHGFQVNTHAIGDRANRRVLDIYEEVLSASDGPTDLRWRVEHAQHLHPDDVERFAELGVVASMQGIHCTSDGPWVPKRVGPDRARSGAYLWRQLLDSGAVVTNGTDVPVERIDPIASYHASITRLMPTGEAFFPAQRMTRMEALESYTINNAYAAFEESLKGSIETGKLADIVVLSADILRQSEDEVPQTRVDYTIVGGEVRYERPQ